MRVPSDLVGHLNKTHITKSLGTSEHGEALSKWREQQGEVEKFVQHQRVEFGLLSPQSTYQLELELRACSKRQIEQMVLDCCPAALQMAERDSATYVDDTEFRGLLAEMVGDCQ